MPRRRRRPTVFHRFLLQRERLQVCIINDYRVLLTKVSSNQRNGHRCEPWENYQKLPTEREDTLEPIYQENNNNNNVPLIERRPPIRAVFKEEDTYEEEEKKTRPVQRFQFANNWNLQRAQQRRN